MLLKRVATVRPYPSKYAQKDDVPLRKPCGHRLTRFPPPFEPALRCWTRRRYTMVLIYIWRRFSRRRYYKAKKLGDRPFMMSTSSSWYTKVCGVGWGWVSVNYIWNWILSVFYLINSFNCLQNSDTKAKTKMESRSGWESELHSQTLTSDSVSPRPSYIAICTNISTCQWSISKLKMSDKKGGTVLGTPQMWEIICTPS